MSYTMSSPLSFNEDLFIHRVINEYYRSLETDSDVDLFDIIEQLKLEYPDFYEYHQNHYSTTSSLVNIIYYKVSDILDNNYYSDADTDTEN